MRRTKEAAEQTRQDILDAAEALFLRKGVAHTSLDEVAKSAGVTRGAVYWHFRNKAHLFHELLSQVRLPTEQMARQLNNSQRTDPLQVLHDHCVNALESLLNNPHKQRIFTILLFRCEFTDELREAEEQHQVFVEEFIQHCQAQFALPACRARLHPGLDPMLAAQTLHALIVGFFNDALRDLERLPPLEHARVMIDVTFRGLLRDWQSA
jgi:TetR/AcrR family transcriptional repressor of mexAB-oprM operon